MKLLSDKTQIPDILKKIYELDINEFSVTYNIAVNDE